MDLPSLLSLHCLCFLYQINYKVLNQMFGLHSLHGLHGLHDNECIGISFSCISDLPCFQSVHGSSLSIIN